MPWNTPKVISGEMSRKNSSPHRHRESPSRFSSLWHFIKPSCCRLDPGLAPEPYPHRPRATVMKLAGFEPVIAEPEIS
jgi:hypothetical protein